MAPESSPSAMTDAEIIEVLAVKVMAWSMGNGFIRDKDGNYYVFPGCAGKVWDPVHNIRDYHMILERIDELDLYWNRTVNGHPNCVQCNLYDLWRDEGPRNDLRHGCLACLKAVSHQ